MIWTDASAFSGYDRSTRRLSTLPASAALASPGEIDVARSATVVPAGTLRLDPSGSVIVTWLISVVEKVGKLSLLFDQIRLSAFCGPPSPLRGFGGTTFARIHERR